MSPTRLLHPARIGPAAIGAAVLVFAAEPAVAHTGHPTGGAVDGLLHPGLGPDPLLAMLAVGVLAAFARDRRVAWATPIGFLAGMLLGALLGFAGIDAPYVELAIAGSVIALGLFVVVRTDNGGLWLPVVTAAFGAAHGHAHGAELPTDAVPLLYALGFVAATAVLHLVGAAAGTRLSRLPTLRMAVGATISALGVAFVFAS